MRVDSNYEHTVFPLTNNAIHSFFKDEIQEILPDLEWIYHEVCWCVGMESENPVYFLILKTYFKNLFTK